MAGNPLLEKVIANAPEANLMSLGDMVVGVRECLLGLTYQWGDGDVYKINGTSRAELAHALDAIERRLAHVSGAAHVEDQLDALLGGATV